jgi:hypothetical protein
MSVSAQYARALRQLLVALMPRDEDFAAFCIDSFRDIHREFATDMDAQQKLNVFIEKQPDPARILDALRTELAQDREREVRRRLKLALQYLKDRKLRPPAVVWTLARIATDETSDLFAALEVVARLLVNPCVKPQDLAPLERWLKDERWFSSSSDRVDDHPSFHLEDWPVLILSWQALYAACDQVDDEAVEMLTSCLALLLRRILPLGKKRAALPAFPFEAMAAVRLLLSLANQVGAPLHATLTNLLVKLCVHNDRLAEALPVLADVPESPGLLYASSQIAETFILRMSGHLEQAADLLAQLFEKLRKSKDEPPDLWMSVALSLLLEIGSKERLKHAYRLTSEYATPGGKACFAYRLAEKHFEEGDRSTAAQWMAEAENAASGSGHEILRQQTKLWRCTAAFHNNEPFATHRETLDVLAENFREHTESRHALGRTLQLRGQWRLRDRGGDDPEQLRGLDDLRNAEFQLRDSGYLEDANRVLAGWSDQLLVRGYQQLENAQYAQSHDFLDRVVQATQHVAQMQPRYEAAQAADRIATQGTQALKYFAALRAGSEEAMLDLVTLALQLVPPKNAPQPHLDAWLRLIFDIGVAFDAYANRDVGAPEYDLADLANRLKLPSDVTTKKDLLEELRLMFENVFKAPPEP